jgi:hypothetical protein
MVCRHLVLSRLVRCGPRRAGPSWVWLWRAAPSWRRHCVLLEHLWFVILRGKVGQIFIQEGSVRPTLAKTLLFQRRDFSGGLSFDPINNPVHPQPFQLVMRKFTLLGPVPHLIAKSTKCDNLFVFKSSSEF